jgi:hypothetical protein
MAHSESLAARSTLCGDLTPQDQRNMTRFSAWLGAWMGVWIGVRFAMEGWPPARQGALAWVLIAASLLPGFVAIAAYMRFLREADELLRKIQLEALAVSLGAGALFMMGWRLVRKAGGPPLDVNDPLLLMIPIWALAQWWGARRYR